MEEAQQQLVHRASAVLLTAGVAPAALAAAAGPTLANAWLSDLVAAMCEALADVMQDLADAVKELVKEVYVFFFLGSPPACSLFLLPGHSGLTMAEIS